MRGYTDDLSVRAPGDLFGEQRAVIDDVLDLKDKVYSTVGRLRNFEFRRVEEELDDIMTGLERLAAVVDKLELAHEDLKERIKRKGSKKVAKKGKKR